MLSGNVCMLIFCIIETKFHKLSRLMFYLFRNFVFSNEVLEHMYLEPCSVVVFNLCISLVFKCCFFVRMFVHPKSIHFYLHNYVYSLLI